MHFWLVASEDVAGVDFVVDVVEAAVVAVGYDGVALGFITPWMELWRKLSELDFIVRR